MGRHGKSVADVHRDFESDFSLLGESLLLCKFCQTVVNWRKRTRIQEHIATRMHQERKRSWTREGEKGVRRGVPVGLGDYRAVQTASPTRSVLAFQLYPRVVAEKHLCSSPFWRL